MQKISMRFRNLRDDLIVQSRLSPTLQKAECVEIPEMTLRSGMNHASLKNECYWRLPGPCHAGRSRQKIKGKSLEFRANGKKVKKAHF